MTSKERVMRALEHRDPDRLPIRHYAEPVVDDQLRALLGLPAVDESGGVRRGLFDCAGVALKQRIGDDFRYVYPEYAGPAPKRYEDGSRQVAFPERGWPIPAIRWIDKAYGDTNATYLEPLLRPFVEIRDPAELEDYVFPQADWLDYSTIQHQCERHSDYCKVLSKSGCDFINGIAYGRGTEQVLVDIGLEDPVFARLQEKNFSYYYEKVEGCLSAAAGGIDIVYFEEDFATQTGPLIGRQAFEKYILRYYKELFALAHSYGCRTMLHVCGSAYAYIPLLVDIGLDILDVIQTSAEKMEIERLHREFSKDLCFCGSMDVQKMMIQATADQIRKELQRRKKLFSHGGLIVGPSHALQEGTPLENIVALYEEAGGLKQVEN